MSVNIQFFNIPGRTHYNLPIVGTNENNEQSGISKATREWELMVPVGGAQVALELFGFSHGIFRDTLTNSTANFISGAATRSADLMVLLQIDNNSPTLEAYMNNSTLLEIVEVRRNGWIKGVFSILEQLIFKTCYIVRFMHILDFLLMQIRVCEVEEKLQIYAQDGSPTGQTSSIIQTVTGLHS
jgi:hypothetical protein